MCFKNVFFNYITYFCSGYRSCSVVQVANFKDIVMFSIKTCSIPLNKQCLLNKINVSKREKWNVIEL